MSHYRNNTNEGGGLRIVVCIKQVPDTTELQVDPETNTLIRQGVEAVLNPLDEFAVEAGIRLRNDLGGEVTVVTMGPPQARRVLDKAMAMGADKGVLLQDKCFAGGDTWATSRTLAAWLEASDGYDLVLCGKQAIDGDTGQVGPGIAAHLGIPQVTHVTGVLRADSETIDVRRMLDAGTVDMRVRLPALISVLKEANEPRLPSLGGAVRALEDAPEIHDAESLGLSAEETGLEGSPTRVVRIETPTVSREKQKLEGSPEKMAYDLVDKLEEDGISLT